MKTKYLMIGLMATMFCLNSALSAEHDSLFTKECVGTVTVNNIGSISEKEVKLKFFGPMLALYSGPHSSISLPKVDLEIHFNTGRNGWNTSNLSNGRGHGREINIFSYRESANNTIDFKYRGLFNYQVEGTLNCFSSAPNM